MRGKGVSDHWTGRGHGITPAYAGKSCRWCQIVPYGEDHPRLCGEKQKPTKVTTTPAGSPPPMRGKEAWRRVPVQLWRITPAYAGKSFCYRRLEYAKKRITPAYAGKRSAWFLRSPLK